MEAMRFWQRNTCLQFVPFSDGLVQHLGHDDHVVFKVGKGYVSWWAYTFGINNNLCKIFLYKYIFHKYLYYYHNNNCLSQTARFPSININHLKTGTIKILSLFWFVIMSGCIFVMCLFFVIWCIFFYLEFDIILNESNNAAKVNTLLS